MKHVVGRGKGLRAFSLRQRLVLEGGAYCAGLRGSIWPNQCAPAA